MNHPFQLHIPKIPKGLRASGFLNLQNTLIRFIRCFQKNMWYLLLSDPNSQGENPPEKSWSWEIILPPKWCFFVHAHHHLHPGDVFLSQIFVWKKIFEKHKIKHQLFKLQVFCCFSFQFFFANSQSLRPGLGRFHPRRFRWRSRKKTNMILLIGWLGRFLLWIFGVLQAV